MCVCVSVCVYVLCTIVRMNVYALARRARARSYTCEPTLGVEGSAPFSGTATTSRFEVRQIYAGLLNAREAPTPVCGFRGGHGVSVDFWIL